jgi:hypothetical protein
MVIVSRNRGGAYIVCDLDGTLSHAPVAAFRVIPYLARRVLIIPDLDDHIDVSVGRLRELEQSNAIDPDNPEVAVNEDEHDYSTNGDDDEALDPEEADHVEGPLYYSKRDDAHHDNPEDAQGPSLFCNRDDSFDLAAMKRRTTIFQ